MSNPFDTDALAKALGAFFTEPGTEPMSTPFDADALAKALGAFFNASTPFDAEALAKALGAFFNELRTERMVTPVDAEALAKALGAFFNEPRTERMITPFDAEALAKALGAFFDEPRAEVPDELARYDLDASFGGKVVKVITEEELAGGNAHEKNGPYWKEKVRPERFGDAKSKGLLYRPGIVNKIIKNIEGAMSEGMGVMVEGPYGVGKSHSLINVVRKLESTGKYLVTFIPNCEIWTNLGDLYDAICQSFGSSMMELIRDTGATPLMEEINFADFVNAVDKILVIQGKKWVFVFDEVNKLFPHSLEKADLSRLPFPFNQTRYLIRTDHRTCVISASANNEIVLSEKQGGFTKYNCNHPFTMDIHELRLAFAELEDRPDTDLAKIVALTGGIPWQIYLRLQEERLDERHVLTPEQLDKKYSTKEMDRIKYSLIQLNSTVHAIIWNDIVKAAISCLMGLGTDVIHFDRKYSYLKDPTEGGKFPENAMKGNLYAPVHPIVLAAYQKYFWDDLMAHIHHEESTLSLC